jgi:hypothetical protein
MAHPDHDQVIGRLVGARLRGTAEPRPGGAPPAARHPDVETWAAYADGGLRPEEAAELDAHLAGCTVCRQLVAAFAPEVSTGAAVPAGTPDLPAAGPAAVLPFPRRHVFAWMGVAAALFGAVTLWSVSRLGGDAPVSEGAVASRPTAAAVPRSDRAPDAGGAPAIDAPVATGRAGDLAATAPRTTPPSPGRDQQRDPATLQRLRQPAAERAAFGAQPPADEKRPAQPTTRQQKASGPAPPAESSVTAPTAAAPPLPVPQAPAPSAVAAAAPDARQERANEQEVAGVTASAAYADGRAAASDVMVTTGATSRRAAPASAAALPSFAEPDGRLRWRIANGRRLESSSDGGITWNLRHTVRGGLLRAGAAPSIDSAWVVGERGLVLRLAVPGGWTVVSPPAAVALIAVSATGAQSARVTAADGRIFETVDGGATWTPVSVGGPQ